MINAALLLLLLNAGSAGALDPPIVLPAEIAELVGSDGRVIDHVVPSVIIALRRLLRS